MIYTKSMSACATVSRMGRLANDRRHDDGFSFIPKPRMLPALGR